MDKMDKWIKQPTQSRSVKQRMSLSKISLQCMLNVISRLFHMLAPKTCGFFSQYVNWYNNGT